MTVQLRITIQLCDMLVSILHRFFVGCPGYIKQAVDTSLDSIVALVS